MSLSTKSRKGFTIVELLIVVVVIAILAAITIVSYNGITASAKESAIKSDLATAAKKLNVHKIQEGSFPVECNSQDYLANLNYSPTANGFCVQASANNKDFYVTEASSVQEGECPPQPLVLQAVTTSSCPTERTLAVDARDNHTYWIQKMPDGKCWMLTNLAYAAGSNNLRQQWLAQFSGSWTGSFALPGSRGYYWSSSQDSATYAHYLYFLSSSVNPANYSSKNYGFSVRCLAS